MLYFPAIPVRLFCLYQFGFFVGFKKFRDLLFLEPCRRVRGTNRASTVRGKGGTTRIQRKIWKERKSKEESVSQGSTHLVRRESMNPRWWMARMRAALGTLILSKAMLVRLQRSEEKSLTTTAGLEVILISGMWASERGIDDAKRRGDAFARAFSAHLARARGLQQIKTIELSWCRSIIMKLCHLHKPSLIFSEYLISGQVPPVKEVNAEEPLFPVALFLIMRPSNAGGVLFVATKDADADLSLAAWIQASVISLELREMQLRCLIYTRTRATS